MPIRAVAHAVYWKLHTAYLKNERQSIKLFLGMLSDYSDEQIKTEITSVHFERFLKIRENVQKDIFGRLYGNGYAVPPIAYSVKSQKSGLEKDFCEKLFTKEGRNRIASILGIPKIFSMLREFELQEYGRVDFLIRHERTQYAIEVKMGEAPNSLVSQIDRYRLALELDMCTGLHDDVKCYVLSEKFTAYEAIELSRLAVNMIEHSGTINSLKLL